MLDAIGKRYVVETGQTENGWFTRYSDGWIEQGGIIPEGSEIDNYVNVFPVTFENTSYTFLSKKEGINTDSSLWAGNAVARSNMFIVAKSTNQITVQRFKNPYCWYACGY